MVDQENRRQLRNFYEDRSSWKKMD